MSILLHKANERGQSNLGWLTSRFSFSFADYYDPNKMGFGVLRVINDDIIAGGTGFGMHPHRDMEIITIPLEGTLEHKDSMGNVGTIRYGEVQMMSAGTGIFHSEYNHSKTENVKLLQIWIMPKERNIQPRYGQFEYNLLPNQLKTIVSPDLENTLHINQDAYFSMYEGDQIFEYSLFEPKNGLYAFVIDGEILVKTDVETELSSRDALGVTDCQNIIFSPKSKSKILLMEVPM
jgi:quercetin 2,3-dioxygenase